tara:strand:+ start:1929 stop:2450 length:522 start_codon:yes stop_codon:yes gene_type:complete
MSFRTTISKYPYYSLILFTIYWSGCGIYSFSGASISDDMQTIYIKQISNQATLISPYLSSNLTEKLKTKCLNETSLNWQEKEADIEFSGFITTYIIEPVSIQNNETAAKNRLTIAVKINYINRVDESQNFNRSFSQYADFDSATNFSEKEEELNNTIIDDLIDDIFNAALVNW